MDLTLLLEILGPGLLALIGGYVGASVARRTEYEKWLRQQKSIAFADFLLELHDTRLAAADAVYDAALPGSAGLMKANELYAKLQKYKAVARLYLSASSREVLERELKVIWLKATSRGGPADHAIEIRDAMQAVQSLFEEELKRY